MRLDAFFKKFDLIADAPNAARKLRDLLVHFAVNGKLTPHRSSENPVNLDLSGPTNETSGLPMNWRVGKLGQVFTFEYGENLPAPKRTQSGEYPVYGSNGVVGTHSRYLTKEPAVVVGRKGSAGALNIAPGPSWTTDVAYYVVPPVEIDLRFTYYLFSTLRLEDLGKGIKPGLSRKEAYELQVAIPPLAEQKRIVAKVDELMTLCDRLEAQQQEREPRHAALARASLARFAEAPTPANLSFLFHPSYTISPAELRKSILTLAVDGKLVCQDGEDEPASKFVHRLQQERRAIYDDLVRGARRDGNRMPKPPRNAFTPYVDSDAAGLPNGWCETRIGDVSDCLDHLRVPVNKSDRLSAHGAVPYYGANGQVGWIDKHLFNEDLVLVVEDETFIGRVKPFSYVVRGKSWVNNHAHVLRPLGGISADFLNIVLCQYPFIPLTSGTTARRKLTQPSLLGAVFALPPLAEQRRIVAKVDQLMSLVDQLEAQLIASRATASKLLDAIVAELTAA